jgi:hypothetical protein
MLPVRSVCCHVVAVALAYRTLQPSTLTVVVPRLNNSMKSFLSVAPLLPPPP